MRPLTMVHLYFKLQGPPGPNSDMGHGDPPSSDPVLPPRDIWWPSLETYSNLFIGPHHTGKVLFPPVLTSGHHQSTYGWKASCMHQTGMLACCKIFL